MNVKKLSGYFLRYFLAIFIFVSSFIFKPMVSEAKSANTLAGLRADLKDLEAQKRANDNQKSLTQGQINSNKNAINNANQEIDSSRKKIEDAKVLIEETNNKIKDLEVKNENLMAYFQIMQGNNLYMEFITESTSMTELIMRVDAIKELASYQQDKLKEMDSLINEQEQLQVDMKKYEDTLEQNIVTYQNAVYSLQGSLANLNEISMDISSQISSQKELIKVYEDMGCREDEDLDECSRVMGNALWLKPLNKGRVNSNFGRRENPLKPGTYKVHQAVDIGGNREGTKVYAVGSGSVAMVINAEQVYNSKKTKTCGGNQVYIWMKVGGKYYTVQYAHLLQIYVKTGDVVTKDTVIGLQGGGSGTRKWERCSTGTHLHFGVSEGKIANNKYFISNWMAHAVKPEGYPSAGGWFYSRTQWF